MTYLGFLNGKSEYLSEVSIQMSMFKRFGLAVLLFLVLASSVAAGSAPRMDLKVCSVISPVVDVFVAIGPTLVLLMFLYGAVKYVYSADDPGGRKQGKDICIHAVIGGMLLLLTWSVLTILGLQAKLCGTVDLAKIPGHT
jgi:hypothetical protein